VPAVATAAPGLFEPPQPQPVQPALSEPQQRIVDSLDEEPTEVELLVQRTGLAAQVVLRELTLLTIRGSVRRIEGQKFARSSRRR
jgi:DNA processing protein